MVRRGHHGGRDRFVSHFGFSRGRCRQRRLGVGAAVPPATKMRVRLSPTISGCLSARVPSPGDQQEALDLSQEVFLRVFGRCRRSGAARHSAPDYRIVVNQASNRQRWWRRRHQTNGSRRGARRHARQAAESRNFAMPDRVLQERRRPGAWDALDRLPLSARGHCCEIDGLSYDEIASSLVWQSAQSSRDWQGTRKPAAGTGGKMSPNTRIALSTSAPMSTANSPARRSRVSQHVDECDNCADRIQASWRHRRSPPRHDAGHHRRLSSRVSRAA